MDVTTLMTVEVELPLVVDLRFLIEGSLGLARSCDYRLAVVRLALGGMVDAVAFWVTAVDAVERGRCLIEVLIGIGRASNVKSNW